MSGREADIGMLPEKISATVQLCVLAPLMTCFMVFVVGGEESAVAWWLIAAFAGSLAGTVLAVALQWRFTEADGVRMVRATLIALLLWLPAVPLSAWFAGAWLFGALSGVIGSLVGLFMTLGVLRLRSCVTE